MNTIRTKALLAIEKKRCVRWPAQMKDNEERMRPLKYYNFYNYRAYLTEKCYQLKEEKKRLVQIGQMREFTRYREGNERRSLG